MARSTIPARGRCIRAPWLSAALFALMLVAPASAGAATNIGQIMPLGDSITDGSGAVGGYRDPLFALLTNHGYVFTYVGSATDNATTALTNAGQTHHEGHSGYVIQTKDPTDPGAGSGRGGIYDSVGTWLAPGNGVNPNYILLMIGTNDVDINYFPATAAARLSALISKISDKSTGLRPSANLIVAQIVPTTSATENVRVQTFNAGVVSTVAAHQALGENVTTVNMYTALTPITGAGGDFTDTLHPNQSGYNKMAQVWYDGIQAVPEPTSAVGMGIVMAAGLMRRGSRREGR